MPLKCNSPPENPLLDRFKKVVKDVAQREVFLANIVRRFWLKLQVGEGVKYKKGSIPSHPFVEILCLSAEEANKEIEETQKSSTFLWNFLPF
jgi:hypothetical protein